MVSGQSQRALLGFPRLQAFLRAFNSVANGVADQMRDRFGECVQDAFVEIGFLASEGEFDVFATSSSRIPD